MVKKYITSNELACARAIETEKVSVISDNQRPSYHVTPPVGWMNDPNGFSAFRGDYHLFFQYHPYSCQWGPMHWGHVKTTDFIKWERVSCAMAPDMSYDAQGCFSGSAIEDQGNHVLMYTGVQTTKLPDGTEETRQTQCIAVGDGSNYEKLQNNPVIRSDELPEGISKSDFRDPKIWKTEDTFYALVGSNNQKGDGQIILFSSADYHTWKFEKVLDQGNGEYGGMWECPDFFPLDGKHVLVLSPQFMQAKGLEFHNGNNSLYFAGDYNPENHEWKRSDALSLDYGLDFYAPQTMQTNDGRRVLIGWMQSWDNYMTPEHLGWSGMMTVPRELSLKDGRLYQLPVRELDQYHQNEVKLDAIHISADKGKVQIPQIKGRTIDMEIEITGGEYSKFVIGVAASTKYETTLTYDQQAGTFTTDRTASGLKNDLLCSRSMYVDKTDRVKMRILMDLYSVEVFLNDGWGVMTSVIFTPLEADEVYFSCDGKLSCNITKYDIAVQ